MRACSRAGCRILIALLALGGAHAAAAPTAPPPAPTVSGEIDRLRQLAATTTTHDEAWPRLRDSLVEQLDAIAAEARAGRDLLALHRLSDTRNTLLAYVFRIRFGSEDFQAVWSRERDALAETPGVGPSAGAAARALAEAARRRVPSYLSASRSFAEATVPASGLFYLGRAQAHADFVDLCRRLPLDGGPGAPPQVRALDAELAAFESRVLAAYVPPRSIERHGDFIGVHAALKLAQELNADGAYFGALYQYLDASVRLAQVLSDPGTADRERLLASYADLERTLNDAAVDHGIGRIFLEQAQGALAAPAEGAAAVDDLNLARAILEGALPTYLEALGQIRVEGRRASAAVTVTLVRWPYT